MLRSALGIAAMFVVLPMFGWAAQPPAKSAGQPGPETVERYTVWETECKAAGKYANPYRELTAEATLRHERGTPKKVPLFWDGGDSWKLRFSPDQIGAWTWSVTSSDTGLNGPGGSFRCVASSRSGSIRPMKDFPLHFERQIGEPFWFLGDTAWALFTDNAQEKHDRAAALAYIDARASQGFNVLHSMLLSEAGWGNAGGKPWHDLAAERLNPDYWQEVDRRLAHANSRGIVCGLALAWGDKRKQEPFAWRMFPDVEARQRYARYVAARYSAFDTYFIVSGEWHGEIRTRPSTAEDVKREFIEIGNALHAADPHGRMIGIHPMTAHGSVREYVGAAKWMSFGDYQQNYLDLHARVLESRSVGNALRGVPLPVVNSEYGYFLRDQSGDGVPDKDNSTSLDAMRHATWDIVMAGGYPVTGFGTTYFGGNRDPGPFDLHAAKNKPWENQYPRVKSVFSELEWWLLEPRDELITCDTPRGQDGKQFNQLVPPAVTYWCLADPGRQYLVYYRGLKQTLTLSLPTDVGQFAATQINPRTGDRRALDRASGTLTLQPPDEQDWVVILTKPAP